MVDMQIDGRQIPRQGMPFGNADEVVEAQSSIDSLTAQVHGLVDMVSNLEAMVTELLDTQRKTNELVSAVKEEIVPAIDQISAGPVGKMLGLKKKEEGK